MAMRLMWLAVAAISLALFIDGMIVLMAPDPVIEHPAVQQVKREPAAIVRVIPPFPQLAAEEPDASVPDAAVQDSGQPYVMLNAMLGGVAWSDDPLKSSVVLEFEHQPDEVEFVYSLNECVDDHRPCQTIRKYWKLVAIDKRSIVVLHRPSGVLETYWLETAKPEEDAGVVKCSPNHMNNYCGSWQAPWMKQWDNWY